MPNSGAGPVDADDQGAELQCGGDRDDDAGDSLPMVGCDTDRYPPGGTISMSERPTIVCLCGSGRFRETFEEAEFQETLAGKIVLTIGCNTKDIARDIDWSHVKPMLDELHLRKIDLADEVLCLNVGQYVGESTARELIYAVEHNKPVRYWEEPV
jgi:hypothetical protein